MDKKYKLKIVWTDSYGANADNEYEVTEIEKRRLLDAPNDKALTINTSTNAIKVFDPKGQIKRFFVTELVPEKPRPDITPSIEEAVLPQAVSSPDDIKKSTEPERFEPCAVLLTRVRTKLNMGDPKTALQLLESQLYVTRVLPIDQAEYDSMYIEACIKLGNIQLAKTRLAQAKAGLGHMSKTRIARLENDITAAVVGNQLEITTAK